VIGQSVPISRKVEKSRPGVKMVGSSGEQWGMDDRRRTTMDDGDDGDDDYTIRLDVAM